MVTWNGQCQIPCKADTALQGIAGGFKIHWLN